MDKFDCIALAESIQVVASSTLENIDPLIRATRCLAWLSDRLEGSGGTLTQVVQPTGPGSIALVQMVDVGYWGPIERAARDAYFRSDDHTVDPFLAEFCKRDFQAGPTAAVREDCLKDDAWYNSPHVKNFRERAQMDSAIYASVPVPEERIFGLSLNRGWGKPAFTSAERDFALAFMVGITPLLAKVWSTIPNSGVAALEDLPIRLRKVMASLLNGDSEKQVSEKLCLSPHTVHSYVKDIYLRFGVSSRGQLLSIFTEGSFRDD